jgi:hypothetical protein
MPTPSLILVPARFKTGKLYTPVATTSGGVVLGASGDFNVTRGTTATRVNANGLIESVASGIPRLDYFASGGVVGCPALLVEPSAANGILNSNNTATNWTRGANLTSGYTDVIGVSGNNLTVAASGSGIGFGAGRLQSTTNNVSLASGSTYTISFLMKKTGTHTIGGYYAVIGGADIASGFDVSGSFSSGSIYNSAPTTNRIRRVEQWGTDVYRCSETFTMTSGTTLTFINFAPLSGVTNANNPAVGLGIAFAAPQIELGAIPTSFIPTSTAAVTRNAEVISISGAVSGCVGQTEGTMYLEFIFRRPTIATAGPCGIASSNNQNRVLFWNNNSTNSMAVNIQVNAANIFNISVGTLIEGTRYKLAIGYKSGNSAIFLNGIQVGSTNTSAFTFAASLVAIFLGTYEAAAASVTNTGINAFTLYTTRLTNTELAALTA